MCVLLHTKIKEVGSNIDKNQSCVNHNNRKMYTLSSLSNKFGVSIDCFFKVNVLISIAIFLDIALIANRALMFK